MFSIMRFCQNLLWNVEKFLTALFAIVKSSSGTELVWNCFNDRAYNFPKRQNTFLGIKHTEKAFLILVKSNQIWILIILFRSEKGNYKIQKIFQKKIITSIRKNFICDRGPILMHRLNSPQYVQYKGCPESREAVGRPKRIM